MSVLIFLAVLFMLILVHEWGHFIAAKKTGMRVDEFGIGFPPKLFGVKKGETEYTINAFPIGGFVKILGENFDETDLSPEDKERTFSAKSKWAQALVLVAGVSMNIIFAWFLFAFVFMAGVPTSVSESEASADAKLTVVDVIPASPAAQAGIQMGAKLTSVKSGSDTLTELTPSAFSQFVSEHGAKQIEITYGDGQTVTVVPEAGVIATEDEKPAVGIALSLVENNSMPIWSAAYEATTATFSTLSAITIGITTLLVDSVRGTADLSQVSGPVGIVGMVGDAAQFGFASLMTFTALISLNLAVINLLPLPALDGGRLLFVAIEAIRRKPLNPVWMARANLIGFALLILLMVVITGSDVMKLI